MAVFKGMHLDDAEITAEVKAHLAQAIDQMLSRRKSIWYGSVFEDEQKRREENVPGKAQAT